MDFTFRQLHIFTEAAADENFRKTADRLNVSQACVSEHIAALERKTGGRLFDRKRGSSARLSPLGRKLLEEAQQLLRQAQKVRSQAQSEELQSETLRVAAGAYIIDNWLRPSLLKYYTLKDVPHLELIEVEPGEEMLLMLNTGGADIGFYTGPAHQGDEFHLEGLRQITYSLYAAPSLADWSDDQEKLSDAPTIMASARSPTETWMLGVLAGVSIHPRNIVARSQYPDVMLELALEGVGISVLFDDDASRHVATGRLIRLPVDFEPMSRYLISKRRFTNTKVQRAIEHLRSVLKGPKYDPRQRLA